MGFKDALKKHADEGFDRDAAEAAFQSNLNLDLPLPPGKYEVKIETCEDAPTKKGGEMRKMMLRLTDSNTQYAKRCLFPIFPFDCGNETAERIAVEQIQAIALAAGESAKKTVNPSDMVGMTFVCRTIVKKDEYKGKTRYVEDLGAVVIDPEPPFGPDPKSERPAIWDEAVEFAKAEEKGEAPKTSSFDDDDLPF